MAGPQDQGEPPGNPCGNTTPRNGKQSHGKDWSREGRRGHFIGDRVLGPARKHPEGRCGKVGEDRLPGLDSGHVGEASFRPGLTSFGCAPPNEGLDVLDVAPLIRANPGGVDDGAE